MRGLSVGDIFFSKENRILTGVQWFKHENYQPVGAFKVRGGINLISQLSPDERARGVIAASTGNHGQSVAYAARLFTLAMNLCSLQGLLPKRWRCCRMSQICKCLSFPSVVEVEQRGLVSWPVLSILLYASSVCRLPPHQLPMSHGGRAT